MLFTGEGYNDPVKLLTRDHDTQQGVRGYVAALHEVGPGGYRITPYLRRMAVAVQPDSVDPIEAAKMPVARAFYDGGLIGARILVKCVPPDVRSAIFNVSFDIPGINNLSEDYQRIGSEHAGAIVANSDVGLNETQDVKEVLEGWEPAYTEDIRVQHFFSRGAGIILFGLQQAHDLVVVETSEIDRFSAASQPDSDAWNQALKDLLGGLGNS